MRIHNIPFVPTAAALVLAIGAGHAPAQETADQTVRTLLGQADAGTWTQVWDIGRRVADVEATEDALAKAIVSVAEGMGPKAHLAAARALADLAEGDSYSKELLQVLAPAAKGDDEDAQAAAMVLLGREERFNRRQIPAVRELLTAPMRSELTAPSVRVEACKSLWRVGSEEEKREARDTLVQFLGSQNRMLKVQGALALAEINTDASGPGWDLLREIQDEPTPEGRLAAHYLRSERERRQFEKFLRTLSERDTTRGGTVAADDDEFATLREILRRVRAHHLQGEQFTDEFLFTNAAKGILEALDRHSSYFTSDEFKRFFFDLDREYGGIGAFVGFDRDDVFSITRPIYSGPAYRAGLRTGDKILEVDGWETAGHSSDEIIARLKGEPNKPVTIKFFRPGFTEPQEMSIVREQIRVPAINHDLLPGQVGYIEVITFAANVAEEIRKALLDLRQRGAQMIVLDVRNNTGGYLEEARDVVELFVSGDHLVVYTAGRDIEREEFRTRDRAVCPDLPMAVLVNEYSASASEIVAGALRELDRAVVVGERSFGKGSVQTLMPLRSQPSEPFQDQNGNRKRDDWESFDDLNGNGKYDVGPRLKLTIARYHLPSGRSPNKEYGEDGKVTNPDWGIIPDIEAKVRELSNDEAWKNAEIFELLKKDVLQSYVRKHMEPNRELFLQLAEGDGGDWSRYPEFEAFYQGLDTHLTKDDVRRWLRYTIRDRVADLRGRAFAGQRALGDHQEDGQLQEAVNALLKKLGRDIRDLKEFQGVLKIAHK